MDLDAPTILIVDNDEGMTAALSFRLGSHGYHCITAASGAQGIAACREQDVDLIITDLNMPAGDGVALAQTVRTFSQIPIVIVSGFHGDFRDRLNRIENVTVLPKPFDTSRLIDLIEADLIMSGVELPAASIG
ncbi:MAG: response regulator [Phycisphaerales bacterium]